MRIGPGMADMRIWARNEGSEEMEKEAKGEIEGKETARGTSAKKVRAKLAF